MTEPSVSRAALRGALAELDRHFEGAVSNRPEELAARSGDFGGMVERRPALVLLPDTERDVATALRIAAEHGISIATRGSGHSQSGQSSGSGLLLDMTRLKDLSVAPDGALFEAQAGATWLSVVNASFPRQRLPVGLTQALDTTLGGTLSVGGIGAESYRTGPQVDNVAFVDVATLQGEIVRCSLQEQARLFDGVRAGLGQCGVIVRVGYPLRSCRPCIHRRAFAYTAVERFLEDALALAGQGVTGRWLTANVTRGPSGARCLVLLVGQEVPSEGRATEQPLPALTFDFELRSSTHATWQVSGLPEHGFFRSFSADTAARHADGSLNPWVEHFLEPSVARAALEVLLRDCTDVLDRGAAGVMLVRRDGDGAPLFATPAGSLTVGVGAFATFPRSERAAAEETMASYIQRMQPFLGKRYLSGYLPEQPPYDWAAHYGRAWPGFRDIKSEHDNRRLLNAGMITWG